MSGAGASGTRGPGRTGGGAHAGHGYDSRDAWPRDLGRDGASGLVTLDRALRSREVSRPDADDERVAADLLAELLARVDGRRQPAVRRRS
jgi:hypothetical protein